MDILNKNVLYQKLRLESCEKFKSKDVFKANGFENSLAYEAYKEYLPIIQPGKILDLGCGNGLLLKFLHDRITDLEPFGIDWNDLSIKQAKEVIVPLFSGNFYEGNIAKFPLNLKGKKFDTILFDPSYILQEDISHLTFKLIKSLSKKGILVFHTYQDTLSALNITSIKELVPQSLLSILKVLEGNHSSFGYIKNQTT